MSSSLQLEPAHVLSLQRRLTAWFRAEQRSMPWRETRDPYAIWISEAMLQQTRVETVLAYWPRFLELFPTLSALAAATEDDVLAAWSGLGYYSRARKLRAAARVIVERFDGEFPRAREHALDLPGVGPYTAGAVLSIAYDLPEALVDGNVQRVFARLFALDGDVQSAALQKEFWNLAAQLVPKGGGAGDWNQALMELGATLCAVRNPNCDPCPLADNCRARAEGRVEELPKRPPRAKPTEVELRVFVVKQDGLVEDGEKFLLEQRPAAGRMAGLWQFPTLEVVANGADAHLFPTTFGAHLGAEAAGSGAPLLELGAARGHLRHSITRYRVRAEIRSARLTGKLPGHWRWFDREHLSEAALTGMARKVLRAENDSPLFGQ